MRATQSQDTVLDKAFCPDELCPVVCPPGFAGAGPFHVAIFAWALTGFAAVYFGAARRAYDITVAKMPTRTSIALTDSMAHHPEVQHHVAKMRMALRRRRGAARPHGRRLGSRRPARGLAGAPRRQPPGRHQRRQRRRRPGARPVRRRGGVPGQPARADLPRRPHGPLPPGQPPVRAGAHRQALPRRRPRRARRAGADRRRDDLRPGHLADRPIRQPAGAHRRQATKA